MIATFLLSSLVMSVIILLTMLINRLFPKAFSARLWYTIWIIILVGLIIPFRPVISNGFISIQAPSSVQMLLDNSESSSTAETVTDTETVQNNTSAETTNSVIGIPVSPFTICFIIWSIIAASIFAYHIWGYVRFIKMIRRWGKPVKDERVLSIFESLQTDLGLSNKKIDLKVCSFVSTSMLTGFFHPVVLLPEKHFDEDELELIFTHELIHYKRHDLFLKLLSVIAISIHWFNPIVYWMCKVMQTDGEASCDEAVLQQTDIEKRHLYAEVIIGMIGNKSKVKTAFSTCFYARKSNIKRRLEAIFDTKQKKRKWSIIGAFLVALLTFLSGSIIAPAQSGDTTGSNNNTSQDSSSNSNKSDCYHDTNHHHGNCHHD